MASTQVVAMEEGAEIGEQLYMNQIFLIVERSLVAATLIGLCIRAGEFSKNFMHLAQKRVFGKKNAPKKRGSPRPNFPPPKFGLLY